MGMYTLLYFKRISSKHLLPWSELCSNVREQPRWKRGVWRGNACLPLSPVRLLERQGL